MANDDRSRLVRVRRLVDRRRLLRRRSWSGIEHLADLLARLHGLLEQPEPVRAASVARLARRARTSRPADLQELAVDVLALYRGAGSLSDLVLQDASGVLPAQAELDDCRAQLFEAARAAR